MRREEMGPMEIWKIVLIVVAVVFGICLGVYFGLKKMAKGGESRKDIRPEYIPELTLAYVKDWFSVEIGTLANRTAAVMLADRVETEITDILPEEAKSNTDHFVVMAASEKGEIYKFRLIQFENMDDSLREMLDNHGGIVKVGNE